MKKVLGPEEAAIEELFLEYYEIFYWFAYDIIGKDLQMAKDLVSEVFMEFLEKARSLGLEKLNAAYFRTAVKNKCINYLRKSRYTQNLPPDTDEIMETKLLRADYNLEIQFLLKQLPPEYRRAMHLFFLEDLEVPAIAVKLGIAESTVYSWIAKARAILKQLDQ